MWLPHRRSARLLSIIAGGLVAIGLGLACLEFSFANKLTRASYDLPFALKDPTRINDRDIVLVYLDEESAKQLNQPLDDAWNRSLHASLLERLTTEGARMAFYDLVFDSPSPEPGQDEQFATALQNFGHAVIGGALDIADTHGDTRKEGVLQSRIIPPLKSFRKAAAGWGLLVLRPIDIDSGVRQIFTGTSEFPSATWKAAELLGAPATKEPRELGQTRWINYYGPPNKTFPSLGLAKALTPGDLPSGYFKDRIVFIGGRNAVGYMNAGKDQFVTPYTGRVSQQSTGVEIQATILRNLLNHEWLTRLPSNWENVIVIVVGVLAGLLALLRPIPAFISALFISASACASAFWLFHYHQGWFNWMVPAAIQIPFGLVWSVGTQYLLESNRRKELRKAFGFYLSPQMADKIADSDFDLRPGGKVVEATIAFTDLENFTTISENLDPTEVSQILTTYFGQTTKCVLDNKGTIIKYIGDAVFAAWGAPIEEPNHALRAAEAACDLRNMSELDVHGTILKTRVGIHTGKVLAGNLGSTYRFDYTMIGDAVNFASRLESLNKYLNTLVLISDAVRQKLGDKFITRRLGEFRVAGKKQSVVIHELLCRCEAESGERAWIEAFEEGIGAFRSKEFAAARDCMDRVRQMRGGSDGPSEFYLRKLSSLEANGHLEEWTGIVELSEK
jgi:adenylate cyclase